MLSLASYCANKLAKTLSVAPLIHTMHIAAGGCSMVAQPLPRCIGLFLLRGQARILILLLTEADWFVVVSAVVFESAEDYGPTLPLLMILRGGALPLRSVLAKLPLAEPGNFMVG